MTVNRPRSSVLSLFDPLSDRDVPSPDSDKENAPLAPLLKHRLVDVGDITIDDPMLTDEELDTDTDTDSDFDPTLHLPTTPARSRHAPAPATLRTPFAELTVDLDPTPVPRNKVFRRHVNTPSSLSHVESVPPPTIAPQDSALASVINAVNFAGVSFADSSSAVVPHNENAVPEEPCCPEITVSAPDVLADSLSTLNITTPDTAIKSPPQSTHDLPDLSPQPQARLRPNPPNTSSRDANRSSIDLYSSFHLQLQSADSSFDLLNDKISFFASGAGMDSFLSTTDGDDSFDMELEEANMENALRRIKEEDSEDKENASFPAVTIHSNNITPEKQEASTPSPTSATISQGSSQRTIRKHFTAPISSPTSPTDDAAYKSLPPSPIFQTLLKAPSDPIPFLAPAAPVFSSPVEEKLQSNGMRTPLRPQEAPFVPPPAIPALKIVKRAREFHHEKSSSSGSASSSDGSAGIAPAIPRPISVSPAPSAPRQVTASAAVTRPNAMMAPSTSNLRSTPATRFATGPRRIPVAEGQPATVGGSQMQRVVSSSTIGPRRVALPNVQPKGTSGLKAPAAVPGPVSGLKPPTKYGTISGGGSALPRPVATGSSKLPAPSSGIVRTKSASGLGSATVGKSGLARRLGFGL